MRRILTLTILCFLAVSSLSTGAVAEPDTTPPTLHSLSADPVVVSIYSGSAVVRIDATITDDISGVQHDGSPCGQICYPTGLELFSPTRQRSAFGFVSHVSGDLYRMGVRFRDWDETGTWSIGYVQLTDNAGNMSELYADDLAALGLSATVEVTDAPPTEHAMTVSLSLKKHLVASGQAVPQDSDPACAQSVVEIARRSGGGWRKVKSVVTDEAGAFKVKLPDRTGKYQATVKVVTTESGTDACLAAESQGAKHRHL